MGTSADRVLGARACTDAQRPHHCRCIRHHLPRIPQAQTPCRSLLCLQGDREKELGVPVSPLCNREQGGVTQSQVGFFTAVCLPLFVNLSLRFPATAPMLEAVGRNYQLWSSLAKDKDKQRES